MGMGAKERALSCTKQNVEKCVVLWDKDDL